MILERTPLLLENLPYGVGWRGFVRPLPYSFDLVAASKSAQKRAIEDRAAAIRRRDRLRQLALEQWRALVDSLVDSLTEIAGKTT